MKKKLVSIMIGLSLLTGSAVMAFGKDKGKSEEKKKKKKGKKKTEPATPK